MRTLVPFASAAKVLRHRTTKIFYECDIENHASFHLAQKAGLEMTGEMLDMIFK